MKVLIVDDHPIVVSGCRALLLADGVDMVAAGDAAEGARLYAEAAPDVAVVDINLPDESGFDLTRRIVAADPAARILVFSMNDDPIYAARALECGALGYVSKNDDPEQFRRAIVEVAAGATYLPPGMADKVLALRAAGATVAPLLDALTPRELEILRLLAKGRSMSEIAGLVSVSYKTVAGQCASLRAKLGARTQMELVRIAVEHRLV